jgi:curved DNA-binding protein CbpA
LAKKYHPDVSAGNNSTAETKMKLLNEAYEILSNPEKRRQYDYNLKNQQYHSAQSANKDTTQNTANQASYATQSTHQKAKDTEKKTGGRGHVRTIRICLFLAILFVVGGLFISNYNKGITAMNNKQFIVAQQYFDNLFIGKSLFADEYAYIEAGVLMENRKYLEALEAFDAIETRSVPTSIIDSLKSKVYAQGISLMVVCSK